MTEQQTTQPVLVREREPDDLQETGAALVEVHDTDGYPVEGVADPVQWLTPPDVIRAWVAELSGQIVGHVAISRPQGEDAVSRWLEQSGDPEERVAVLARLFVRRQARGHAIGERLMTAATDYAQRHGLRLVLDVMTKDRAAIRLYERLGWQPLGDTTHSFGDGQEIPAVCYVSPEA